ncbi:MAG: glutathione S-transferase [Myxococcales bacterium]|nr:glutathione S-transferase [Myxococcales bacterium]
MSPSAPAHLLHFRVSHYNEKVRWALDLKGVAHTREALVPGLHIPRVRFLTGQSKVPVLVLDGEALPGSAAIIDELERRYPEPPLYPADPAERERALALQAHFDDEVAPDLRKLFWSCYFDHPADCARLATDGFSASMRWFWRGIFPVIRPLFVKNMGGDPDGVERARGRLSSHFDRLESEIGKSGYLVGDSFSVADLTAAAVMTAIIRPKQFSYPLPEPWPKELVAMKQSLSDRSGFDWVEDIYARHRGASAELV